jgi:hypothetical protein
MSCARLTQLDVFPVRFAPVVRSTYPGGPTTNSPGGLTSPRGESPIERRCPRAIGPGRRPSSCLAGARARPAQTAPLRPPHLRRRSWTPCSDACLVAPSSSSWRCRPSRGRGPPPRPRARSPRCSPTSGARTWPGSAAPPSPWPRQAPPPAPARPPPPSARRWRSTTPSSATSPPSPWSASASPPSAPSPRPCGRPTRPPAWRRSPPCAAWGPAPRALTRPCAAP